MWGLTPARPRWACWKSGGINATVAQPAAQEGADAAQFAYDKITGRTGGIASSVQLPDVLITSQDAKLPSFVISTSTSRDRSRDQARSSPVTDP